MLKDFTRGRSDILAAWSVDLLGRSLTDLLAILGELHVKGVDLYLHQEGVNTTRASPHLPGGAEDTTLIFRGHCASGPNTNQTPAARPSTWELTI